MDNYSDLLLTTPAVENLCLVANIQLVFEEENHWTVIIKPDARELLNGYYYSDYMSFHISNSITSEDIKMKRYFSEIDNNKIANSKEKYIFVFSKRSVDGGFTYYWHFDFLMEPIPLIQILGSEMTDFW